MRMVFTPALSRRCRLAVRDKVALGKPLAAHWAALTTIDKEHAEDELDKSSAKKWKSTQKWSRVNIPDRCAHGIFPCSVPL